LGPLTTHPAGGDPLGTGVGVAIGVGVGHGTTAPDGSRVRQPLWLGPGLGAGDGVGHGPDWPAVPLPGRRGHRTESCRRPFIARNAR
jgi:hypothetical protein